MSYESISLPWESQCAHFPVYFLQFHLDTLSLGCLAQKENARTCQTRHGMELQQWFATVLMNDCRDAGGWHWLQEGCWLLCWGGSRHFVCIGPLPVTIIEKKKKKKDVNEKIPFAIQIISQSEVFHCNFKNTTCNAKQQFKIEMRVCMVFGY